MKFSRQLDTFDAVTAEEQGGAILARDRQSADEERLRVPAVQFLSGAIPQERCATDVLLPAVHRRLRLAARRDHLAPAVGETDVVDRLRAALVACYFAAGLGVPKNYRIVVR